MKTPAKRRAVEVSAATGLVGLAAVLPWGEVDFSKISMPVGGDFGQGLNQMMASFGTVPVMVWNGHADIAGLQIPNVLVVLAAAAVTVVVWLKAILGWNVRSAILIGLASYGLAHCGYVLASLVMAVEGTPRFGGFLAVLAFTWMLVAVLRRESPPERLEISAEETARS